MIITILSVAAIPSAEFVVVADLNRPVYSESNGGLEIPDGVGAYSQLWSHLELRYFRRM